MSDDPQTTRTIRPASLEDHEDLGGVTMTTLNVGERVITPDFLGSLKTTLRTQRVPIPEWGDGVVAYIREMTGIERDQWEATVAQVTPDGKTRMNRENFRATLLVLCLVDESGRRLFQPAHAPLLGQQGSMVISRLFNVAARLNGITRQDEEDLQQSFRGD